MNTTTLGTARRPGIILATCCLSLFVVGVNVTIVNIALPSIQRSFGASIGGLQWTVDAYTLALASLLMLSGSLADRFGPAGSSRPGCCCSPSARCCAAWLRGSAG